MAPLWLNPRGYPLFKSSTDRRGTLIEETSSNENYHHPRHLMLNLQAVERLLARKGRPSDFWNEAAKQ